MNNELCVGSLTNIRDMFVIGSERCEGEALKYHQNFISALNYAIELINSTERTQSEWIPVSERLPEINKEVIITDIETSNTYQSRYVGNGYWECDNGTLKNRVIAWQPLPKPYEKAVKKNETY